MPRRNATATKSRSRRSNHRWPECPATGKVRLGERKDVHLALKAARERRQLAALNGGNSSRNECRGYQCTACSGWHLTSSAARKEPRRSSSGRP